MWRRCKNPFREKSVAPAFELIPSIKPNGFSAVIPGIKKQSPDGSVKEVLLGTFDFFEARENKKDKKRMEHLDSWVSYVEESIRLRIDMFVRLNGYKPDRIDYYPAIRRHTIIDQDCYEDEHFAEYMMRYLQVGDKNTDRFIIDDIRTILYTEGDSITVVSYFIV